ncbi:hypothetical protein RCH09_003657 [Actimicrobium sp. GrIS 1.19]|uniref:hypothetical protein n=1 Tax=Actimicrobium sp. GrIS 1.19 TaxID=3071708 RepID=UPI002E04945C|nr:hypothetical protein [Actimicrobium sp. GrIS 1.19]
MPKTKTAKTGNKTQTPPTRRLLTGAVAKFAKFSPEFMADGRGDQQQNRRYAATELNAQCDLTAPMPTDLQDWENAPVVGSEKL